MAEKICVTPSAATALTAGFVYCFSCACVILIRGHCCQLGNAWNIEYRLRNHLLHLRNFEMLQRSSIQNLGFHNNPSHLSTVLQRNFVQQLSFVMNEFWVFSVQVYSTASFSITVIFNHSKRTCVNNDHSISEKLVYCSQGSNVHFLTLSLHSRNKSQSSLLTPFSTVNNEGSIVF